MSTLKLENIKHENSSTNNMVMDSDGSVSTTGNATVGGTLGVTGATTFSGDVGIGGIATDTAWSTQIYGNREVSIDGGGGYGVLHFRGDGAGSTNTRFSMGVGDGNFYMAYDDVTTTHRMQIGSGGAVTMPSQPFVRLELTSHSFPNQSVSYPGNQVVGFTVKENVGNHWNSSNNNFTCPVAGVYTISVFFIKFPVTGHAHVDLHKNGSLVDNSVRWRAPEINNGYHQAGGTVSVTCAANDVIDWHYFGDAGVHNTNGAWQIMLSH